MHQRSGSGSKGFELGELGFQGLPGEAKASPKSLRYAGAQIEKKKLSRITVVHHDAACAIALPSNLGERLDREPG